MNRSFTVEIEKIVYGGRGMGRINGKIVFVPFTAPGDRVQVELVREGKDYAEAVLKTIEQSSPLRVKPFCSLFGKCGGCHYQHIGYPHQLKLKENDVRDALLRLAHEENFELLRPIPSPHERGYRIRAQLKGGVIEGSEVLGFYGLKSHQLVEIKECPLLHPLANEILQRLQKWLRRKDREYCVRRADIQVSPDEDRGVVRLRGERLETAQMAEVLSKEIPQVKGIILEGKRKISWGEPVLLYCCPKIFEKESLHLRASYDSFSQVNPYQNWSLIRKVVEWAGLSGGETVLDLFCGSGNFTLPLAQRAFRVWGVDKDPRAIGNAVENARQNKLGNCTFIAADGAEGIGRILKETDSIDVTVLDPPRAGAKNILKPLSRLAPEKILYVSCEPPTLARDLSRLKMMGYHLRRIQPLDMFPQTYHIEVVAELIKGQK